MTCIGYGIESHEADGISGNEQLCPQCLSGLLSDIVTAEPRFGWRRGGFIGPLPAPEGWTP